MNPTFRSGLDRARVLVTAVLAFLAAVPARVGRASRTAYRFVRYQARQFRLWLHDRGRCEIEVARGHYWFRRGDVTEISAGEPYVSQVYHDTHSAPTVRVTIAGEMHSFIGADGDQALEQLARDGAISAAEASARRAQHAQANDAFMHAVSESRARTTLGGSIGS